MREFQVVGVVQNSKRIPKNSEHSERLTSGVSKEFRFEFWKNTDWNSGRVLTEIVRQSRLELCMKFWENIFWNSDYNSVWSSERTPSGNLEEFGVVDRNSKRVPSEIVRVSRLQCRDNSIWNTQIILSEILKGNSSGNSEEIPSGILWEVRQFWENSIWKCKRIPSGNFKEFRLETSFRSCERVLLGILRKQSWDNCIRRSERILFENSDRIPSEVPRKFRLGIQENSV